MGKKRPGDRIELVYGALDMLVLRTLRWGPTHGHGIAKSIERMSEDALKSGPWFSLPSAAAAIARGLDYSGVGRFRKQAAG